MGRSTKRQVHERVEEILRLRLLGYELRDIAQHSAANGWGVQSRQLQHYIHQADDLLARQSQQGREQLIALHIARRITLFRLAVRRREFRTALATLCDLAKLQGLYPARKLDVTDATPQGPPPLTPEERDELVLALWERLGHRATCTPPGFAVGPDGSLHKIKDSAAGPPNLN
jgi:hypothetical protein